MAFLWSPARAPFAAAPVMPPSGPPLHDDPRPPEDPSGEESDASPKDPQAPGGTPDDADAPLDNPLRMEVDTLRALLKKKRPPPPDDGD